MPPAFLEGGGGGGGWGGGRGEGRGTNYRAVAAEQYKSDTADWGGGGEVERGSSIYEQGCNIKSATAFAVLAVASAPPM